MIEVVRHLLLAVHLLGMAAVVGPFLVQVRAQRGFAVGTMRTGASVQVVSGIALVAVRYAGGLEVDVVKYAVKLGLGVVVLVAAGLAGREDRAKRWFHVAGGTAVVNVLIAALWF